MNYTEEDLMALDIEDVKEIATSLGLTYSPNIGKKTLVDRVLASYSKSTEESVPSKPKKKKKETIQDILGKSEKDIKAFLNDPPEWATRSDIRKANRHVYMKLRRIILKPVAPAYQDMSMAYVSVENEFIEASRYVPFNVPWHVEEVLYQELKQKKAVSVKAKGTRERQTQEYFDIPAFSVEDLDPLTKEEVKALGKEQEASGRITD